VRNIFTHQLTFDYFSHPHHGPTETDPLTERRFTCTRPFYAELDYKQSVWKALTKSGSVLKQEIIIPTNPSSISW